ncbi:uncharacterized protein LOC141537420 [Cotesia typhae]|uniref:uncharacterized protein LOC141537420 n=1 Tax=Cotesia typhae TaxID=2053667 RepID=UPI003D6945B9
MKAVLDFNGYFDLQKKFHIKEYSLFSLDHHGNVVNIIHEIFSSSTQDFNKLDLITQQNYVRYYQKYGLEWTSRTYTTGRIQPEVPYFLFNSGLTFVANQIKENVLREYLKELSVENILLYDFICLQDIGHHPEASHRQRDLCSYHMNPNYNYCARDNVLDMVRFITTNHLFNNHVLKRIHVAIDFNNWKADSSGIKELSIINISHNGALAENKLEVLIGSTKTDENPVVYRKYYRKHGIKWRFGNRDFKSFRANLNITLHQALFVYVKNDTQKEILCQVNRKARNKIICLDKFGYIPGNSELAKTKCSWHYNQNINNCAADNARLMANWLVQNKLYKKPRRDWMMQLSVQGESESFLASAQLANRAKYYQSIDQQLKLPIDIPPNSLTEGNKRRLNNNLKRFYESFGSEGALPKRQRVESSSEDSQTDDEDIDPDFGEYLDKNDLRTLKFDPEIFNRATDELIAGREEMDNGSEELSLERLLNDGRSSSNAMHNFDADLFDESFGEML